MTPAATPQGGSDGATPAATPQGGSDGATPAATPQGGSDGAAIADWLLPLLACPATRGPLRLVGHELVSDAAGLAYPIRDGVPVLIAEEARRFDSTG